MTLMPRRVNSLRKPLICDRDQSSPPVCMTIAAVAPLAFTCSITAAGKTAGTPVMKSGNRPLLGFDEDDDIITLRHVRELGRALFIARGAHPLGVQIFDGSTVTTAPGDDNRMFVLYLLRIDNLIELRAEPVDRTASDAAILAQFGFTLTPYVSTRETRSR